VPRDQLASVLSLIRRALKPGGAFYASYKSGDGDGRDALDRYYNYPTEDWLRATYAQSGVWRDMSIETGEVRGFDGAMAKMFFVLARKSP
jgi:predicted TPR repeat methyltransferase